MTARTSPRLRSRRSRRIVVAAILAITVLLGSLLPQSLHGFGIAVVLALAGLDVLLVQATGGLAFARGRTLDERERALRDLAHRRGFRLLGLGALLEVVVLLASAFLTTIVLPGHSGFGDSAVNNGVSGRGVVILVQLLLMTPTLVIAWVDGDGESDETSGGRGRSARLAWLALPAAAAAWLALILVAPEQVVTASNASVASGVQGATCLYVATGHMVGAEFGATVGMRVDVCWNGQDAFVLGDPSIPLPQSAAAAMEADIPPADRPPLSDMNSLNPGLSGCGQDNTEDFATVSSTTCSGVIDAHGTLHYSVHAVVSGPLGIGQRGVTLTLVVDRRGNVLQRP
jgi:hypothetical protein